ncbi:hypothetical protein N7I30_21110 [Aurantimonas litoralis]|nr:hypothetical protein [Aurantimonas litoralis]
MNTSSATDAELAAEYEATAREKIDELTGVLDSAIADLMDISDFDDGFGSLKSIGEACGHLGRALDLLDCMSGERVAVKRGEEVCEGVYYWNPYHDRDLILVTYEGRSSVSRIGRSSSQKVAKRLLTQLVIEAAVVPEAVQ